MASPSKWSPQKPIASAAQLENILGAASPMIVAKKVSQLDAYMRAFIASSPLAILSTSDAGGKCDASPRGDGPGFSHVLNETQILLPDRPGNRLADSMRNILENPRLGLLYLIPGLGETLRINGNASLFQDEAVLATLQVNGKTPAVAILIDIEECFIHCARALLRSKLWEPESWTRPSLPDLAEAFLAQTKTTDVTPDALRAALKDSYANLY